MNATEITATLSTRAEDVCRRYLPRGRKQGRYWTAGDTSGAKERSLFVRLAPPGIPGKWTDAATNEHGDLLDLIRLHTGGASLLRAMEEALAFLSLPPSTPANGGDHAGGYDREEAARRLWRRCRPIDGTHAEAYLHARAIGYCRFPALRFHPDLIHRGDNGIHRLPALVAAVTGNDGPVEGVQRTWLDPKQPGKADLVRPRKALGRLHGRAVRIGGSASGATLLAGEGIETVLSLVTVVPGIQAAAAIPHYNFIIRIPKTATTDRRPSNAVSLLCEPACTLVRLRTDHCLLPTPWTWPPRQPSFPAIRPCPETSADCAP